MTRKSREILKNFIRMAFVNIFFLLLELAIAYVEKQPMRIILYINACCFVILLIITIIKLIRKDDELSMYSSLLLFVCSISWVLPILLYGSIFGKRTGIVAGILYIASIGIGILIPLLQGKIDKNRPFWIAIRKITTTFTVCIIFVLNVLGQAFRGAHGGRLMQKTMSASATGRFMWGLVLFMSMMLGGLSVFCIIGNSQNPNSEFNKKRRRGGQ